MPIRTPTVSQNETIWSDKASTPVVRGLSLPPTISCRTGLNWGITNRKTPVMMIAPRTQDHGGIADRLEDDAARVAGQFQVAVEAREHLAEPARLDARLQDPPVERRELLLPFPERFLDGHARLQVVGDTRR